MTHTLATSLFITTSILGHRNFLLELRKPSHVVSLLTHHQYQLFHMKNRQVLFAYFALLFVKILSNIRLVIESVFGGKSWENFAQKIVNFLISSRHQLQLSIKFNLCRTRVAFLTIFAIFLYFLNIFLIFLFFSNVRCRLSSQVEVWYNYVLQA